MAVLTALVGFMASAAYMPPPAMPYVAISIGSGWTSAKDTFLYGLYLLIVTTASAVLVAYTIGSQLLSNLV
ncbi:hypothetical protein [Aerococcus agrisoli]|uniref:hypothetical protein n=1 Tax=Aerococcus agrisoli TaxID=2487350 RepID=UPI001F178690|nr:hypothetical protein [Aerococcus agrisoli]